MHSRVPRLDFAAHSLSIGLVFRSGDDRMADYYSVLARAVVNLEFAGSRQNCSLGRARAVHTAYRTSQMPITWVKCRKRSLRCVRHRLSCGDHRLQRRHLSARSGARLRRRYPISDPAWRYGGSGVFIGPLVPHSIPEAPRLQSERRSCQMSQLSGARRSIGARFERISP
jgi:hypothetical protein